MDIIIYILVFLFFDIVFLFYLSRKYKSKPWQLKKLFQAWYKEFGGY